VLLCKRASPLLQKVKHLASEKEKAHRMCVKLWNAECPLRGAEETVCHHGNKTPPVCDVTNCSFVISFNGAFVLCRLNMSGISANDTSHVISTTTDDV
jgi:hypothetical protein